MGFRAAIILVLSLLAGGAWSQEPVVHRLSADTQKVDVAGSVGLLVDPDDSMTPEQVAVLAERGEMKRAANPSARILRRDSLHTQWLKVDVFASPGTPAEWLLDIGMPLHQRVRLYTQAEDGRWVGSAEVGSALPFSARIVPHRDFVFPVSIPAGRKTTMLVRIQDTGAPGITATLWQPQALRASDETFIGLFSLYYGLLGGMLAYNLLLYVVVRDRGFLYFAGFISCLAVALAANTGLGPQFIWGDWTGWKRTAPAGYMAGMTFSIALTRHFLSTRARLPVVDKILIGIGCFAAMGVIVAATLPSHFVGLFLFPSAVTLSILMLGLSILAVLSRWPGAIFFFAAWVAMHIGSLTAVARYFSLVPWSLTTPEAVALGSALEMILLSLALADRINEERRLKERAQAHTLAILQASQALSSETRLDRLHKRLCDVMGAVTGATAVRFVLWDADLKQWFLYGADDAARRIPSGEALARGLLPGHALRHVEETRQPLIVEDALRDERFAADPAFAGASRCSLMVLPILQHGQLTAVLLLENRSTRGAFTQVALEAVQAIAGALAVSLENVLLYEHLEERVAEQTRELRDTQRQLLATARRAGMAEVATNVLHNVGNTLNSVNVAAELIRTRLQASRVAALERAVGLLDAHAGDLGDFMSNDTRGKLLPQYLREMSTVLEQERQEVLEHLADLSNSVEHIKAVVATQQSHAGPSVLTEQVVPAELLDDALRIAVDPVRAQQVEIVREIAQVSPVRLDKSRTMQILVNLVTNARQAMDHIGVQARQLTVRMEADDGKLRFQVKDSGCGIAPDNLTRIFSRGFTTRSGGHGFGLHSCALAASEMGGSLAAHSEGPGRGATFTLELPLVPA